MVDNLVTVKDFTLSVDFAKDAFALFKEEISKRKMLKSYWELFQDVRKLYARYQIGDLIKNVNFYVKTRSFFRDFIYSSLFHELDKLDPVEALEKFLKMFQPPPPPQPQPKPQPKKGPKGGKGKGKGKGKGQGQPQQKQGKGGKQGQTQKQGSGSPSGKSQDKKGLSANEANLPIDMTKFRKNLPKIEKALDSGILNKGDFQKYLSKSAGIGHKEIEIGNIVKLIEKIATELHERELDIFYIARKKELTEKYRREKVLKSVPFPDNEMSVDRLKKHEDLLKTVPTQFALDDDLFFQKFLKKELLVRDYQSRRLKKQALYMLIDVSGSMRSARNTYASGVSLSLVRQAIDEGATYFLRFFDGSPHDLHKITTKKEAEEMASVLVKQPYSGGGTNIEAAIEKAIIDIKKDPIKFEKAEIMVITDGEDGVNLSKKDLKGIKVHSTIIDGDNSGLEDISETYTKLDSNDIEN